MEKKISFIIFKLIYLIDKLVQLTFKRSFLIWFPDFISHYKKIKEFNFFVPNKLIKFRVNTFYSKEPETLEWIDSFEKESCFWDIGANIGLYSVYCGVKKNAEIFSFEPSTSNLRTLSRNISINNLQNNVTIVPFPLINESGFKTAKMSESIFVEGGAENNFKTNFDWQGNLFKSSNSYKIFGTSIDYLTSNQIIRIPDYIKIDVDGVEHLILQGGLSTLKSPKIKSILIELNESFEDQFNECKKIMKDCGFSFLKKVSTGVTSEEYSKVYNYIYIKK
jgi:FkbM family methyltransferase